VQFIYIETVEYPARRLTARNTQQYI